ncbi:RE1-silencing transcription factor-like [Diachasmimorpha longicaudata]|uniref:RE1-silencing transcription factor-like n=1 Tax=Diachasmimorpha longicaudata TaxID=58733 RepID=UPI0030B87872
MENRPAPLRSRRVCRFCLTESEPLNFIYERDPNKPFQVPLALQIMSCVAIEVYAADGMPQMICTMCRWNLDRSYKFKQQCKKADEALRAYPMTGTLPRPFPPITNESPEGSNKRPAEQRSQSDQSKKPRVDNGDRDRRERAESQSLKSERELYKEEVEHDSEADQEAVGDQEDRKLEPGEIRVHACDQCERTFPLRQALQLHIQRAHRDRNSKCTICDRMFFSKYDLQKHMTTHSTDKPHVCTICNKSFTRANLLQRHEKVHREDMRYPCQHCDREFFTPEELEKHEDTSHKTAKPFQCNICTKRFTYKQGLERHEMLHNEDKSFTCEYCKEAFRTSTKLARHLTTHAGHRPYVCKLCPKTFLLSHHLTRHMRSHSVEKRHVCEDCGKAFKRKESLEVHQLTHTKRSGMGLTCDVCQESCRNRADYVTHIKQHIEAGEKMGPDGLQPDIKDKLESESDEEEEEEQYSDGDDDYEPPAYVVKKLPKKVKQPSESDEEAEVEKDERKDQVVFVRGKDGTIVKKTIKTLMPIQRQETRTSPRTPQAKGQVKREDSPKTSRGNDDTEAEVQKILASVFKEHKLPLKGENTQEKAEMIHRQIKEEVKTTEGLPKVNTVKVIKRIVVKKPGGTETTTTTAKEVKEPEVKTPATPGPKVTKRVIVRRIIRQGDTTREVIMNPDGTIIDPAELAKLPTGNVVKRVVVKKPMEKVQNLMQVVQNAEARNIVAESPKFELKTSQASSSTAGDKPVVQKVEVTKTVTISKDDQETKEKLEQLEKRVEAQRLKIEELQARKQQEYDPADEMSLPERHDSEDEQELPLKRVFVKRNKSVYDEEQEYNDNDKGDGKEGTGSDKVQDKEVKKITHIKIETPSEVDEMNRELTSILESTDNVVKMQESVLSNLTEVSGMSEGVQEPGEENADKAAEGEQPVEMAVDEPVRSQVEIKMERLTQESDGQSAEMEVDQAEEQMEGQEQVLEANQEQTPGEATGMFETTEGDSGQKDGALEDSVVALSETNETINLNDTNESQDSLENELQKIAG